jgi:hypothetical protein
LAHDHSDQNPGRGDYWMTKGSLFSIWEAKQADNRKNLEEISVARALAFAMGCHMRGDDAPWTQVWRERQCGSFALHRED